MLVFALFLGFLCTSIIGVSILLGAQSAIHEIEAFILFLIAAVLFSGACIVDSIKGLKSKKREKKSVRAEEKK